MRFGLDVSGAPVLDTLKDIEAAERAGVGAVWMTSGAGGEQLALLAAAAARTSKIRLGSAVVPIFPRHPILAVQGATVVDALAPHRMRLGLGPSHEAIVKGWLGVSFDKPLEHLSEYVAVVRQAFEDGKVDFEGEHYTVHHAGLQKSSMPIMISALRPGAFRLAGEISDGAIAWNCPASYLATQALQALREGATTRNRPAPPLIAHCWLAPHENVGEVHRAARQRLSFYAKLPFYSKMWEAAGASSAASGDIEGGFIDTLVAHGSPEECVQRLRAFGQASGAHEVIVSLLVPESSNRAGVVEAAIDILAKLEKSPSPGPQLIA